MGFKVNDWVYLKVSPMKGVMSFGIRENLDPDMLDLIEYPKELTMYFMSRCTKKIHIASSEILYFYI